MNSEIFEKAKLYFLEGSKLYQENNYDLAEKQFIKSLELVPERLSTILNLISIFIKTDQKIKLQEILDKYKNLNNEKEILYGLAFNYYFCESFSANFGRKRCSEQGQQTWNDRWHTKCTPKEGRKQEIHTFPMDFANFEVQ